MKIWHPLGALGCFLMLRGIGLSMKELKENSFVWGFEREEV